MRLDTLEYILLVFAAIGGYEFYKWRKLLKRNKK